MARRDAELLPSKPSARLRIYAWSPKNPPAGYDGLIKVGQTTKEDVRERIRESQGQMQQEFTLHADIIAEREDGSIFRDKDVIQRLKAKGFANPHFGSATEWVRCKPADVLTAIAELRTGVEYTGERYQTFAMRPEQARAVEQTLGRGSECGPAFLVERQDALRQDLYHLPARQAHGSQTCAGRDLQTCRPRRLA